jgi:hypothetical protein
MADLAEQIPLDTIKLRFPRTAADLFRLLALGPSPLETLLARIDMDGVSQAMIDQVVHRRPPGPAAAPTANAGAADLQAALLSDEFQRGIRGHLATAFADLPRTYLVSPYGPAEDLSRLLPLEPRLADPRLTSKADFLTTIAGLVRLVPHVEGWLILVAGPLADFADDLRPRPTDRLVATSADPVVATGTGETLDYLTIHQPPAGALTLCFATRGTSARDLDAATDVLAGGWSAIEPDYVWSNGARATLHLPRPSNTIDHLLRLHAAPFTSGDRLPAQDVTIIVNGTPAAAARLTDHAVLEIDLPAALLAAPNLTTTRLTIELDIPTAARPIDVDNSRDDRRLGLSLRRLDLFAKPREGPAIPPSNIPPLASPPNSAEPDISDRDLMMRFESLGENCEFGLVQRRCGAEPLGLLRFASAPLPRLIAGLRDHFATMGRHDNIDVQCPAGSREFMVLDRCYGFYYHAWATVDDMTAQAVHEREVRRVPFLVRKLLEDLADGEKIFVFHGMKRLSEADARALATVIAGFGPGTLLWVEAAEAGQAPGTVDVLGDNLLRGWIDRFAPTENAHDFSLACWITLCRNALRRHAAR